MCSDPEVGTRRWGICISLAIYGGVYISLTYERQAYLLKCDVPLEIGFFGVPRA